MIFFVSLLFTITKNIFFDPPSSVERIKAISESVRTLIIPYNVKIILNDAAKGSLTLETVECEDNSCLSRICKDAFSQCPNLRFVDFSRCSKLWVIESGAFFHTGLQDVILPESLKNIEKMAFSDTQLRSVKIPDQTLWIGEKCFFKSKLEDITFSVKSVLHQISDFAFAETLLTKVEFPELLDVIGSGVFAGTPLSNISFLGGHSAFDVVNQTVIKKSSHRIVASFVSEELNVVIPSDVIDISYGSFLYSKIEQIVIPPSVKYIRERAFAYSNLINITIPKTILVIEKYAFLKCKNLQSIVIESTNTEIVAKAFSQTGVNCGVKCPLEMLTKLRIAGIPSYAFQECSVEENSDEDGNDEQNDDGNDGDKDEDEDEDDDDEESEYIEYEVEIEEEVENDNSEIQTPKHEYNDEI